MSSLSPELRKSLEKTIIQARDVAEEALEAALQPLGVGLPKLPTHLEEAGAKLRRQLRTHGRSLGDRLHGDDRQETAKLVQEGAYEHWHRMLFARFLAENNLLLHPEMGVGVSLAECEELAQEEGSNLWELAGRYASRMLPQIFRPDNPVLQVKLAPNHQQALEKLLADLPGEVFQADDSLGWVYQFWQAKRKDEVNKSEVKIGAEELPAVTQLFTEDYMVDFLLHNSLGAWWVTRHPGQPSPVPLTYLRTLEDGTPAAGRFEGWPNTLKDFTLLDPCCGSGHFLVAAFRLLVALRMADEGLSAAEAVDAVLSQNLHGLELDARCVEIAVFALALTAWTTPNEDGRPLGVRPGMPSPVVACCGLKVAAKVEDWLALVPEEHPDSDRLRAGLRRLHSTFQQAPLLGSLLDPGREAGDLFAADYGDLQGLLAQALSAEDTEATEQALSAKGLMEAAQLLGAQYNLVITNVPYLVRGKQEDALKNFCETHYPAAKNDLANAFLERCIELSRRQGQGVVQIVMPQNWLFLTRYKYQRESLLKRVEWNLLARLGPGAFETISGEVVQVVLLTQTHVPAKEGSQLCGVDASALKSAQKKAALLCQGKLVSVSQSRQIENPCSMVNFEEISDLPLLANYCETLAGAYAGDGFRFLRQFWEVEVNHDYWSWNQTTVEKTCHFSGLEQVVFLQQEKGEMYRLAQSVKHLNHAAQNWLRGKPFWGKIGITISQMSSLPASTYLGSVYDTNCCAIVPNSPEYFGPIFCFLNDPSFGMSVRKIDQSLKVTPKNLLKIPFDLDYWGTVARENYPQGLPLPYSNDPTQWIFHSHPCGSVVWDKDVKWTTDGPMRQDETVLQVAVARLLGYRWPADLDLTMELAREQRAWVNCCEALLSFADDDGFVPIPAMRGEQPAEGRLRQMLAAAFGSDWSTTKEQELLQAVGYSGKSLEAWLRDGFFEQHCRLFHQRPFIWQVWDGLRDGFSVLVNYHKLDRKGLESLTYSYLGDWINRQRDAASKNESGAQGKLEKALELQKKLVAILEGDSPYDIFVRWKPLDQQPIGWEPDLNDGVRLNIRPFMTAGVLRKDPKINWNKDRGTDVESAPWYHLGPEYGGKKGDRINDHHLSLEEKRAARTASVTV